MSTHKFYITTPIYYVNDKPHIGHAYTTCAADILARFSKLNGQDVFFLTGTDEHGAKIAEAAAKAGLEPQIFCDQMAAVFQNTWMKLNVQPSYFIRTTDLEHQDLVVKFLTHLHKQDVLYKKDYSGLYCVGCEKFITEKELIDGKCPDHKCVPERVTEKNWFFKLKSFLPQIEKLIKNNELVIQPEKAKSEVLGLLRQGLDDFSISRQKVKWGIPVPWDNTQIIYVWVDALLNYWTAIQDKKLEGFWPPDVHLMSHDILKFHAIYWPAMLLAYGFKVEELPNKIFVHGYFTINGQKMSKSLGNVIDPNDLVKKFGVDATRYLLMSQFPFGNDGDISLSKLTETYNAALANGLGNLVARVAKFGIEKQESRIKSQELEEYNCLMSSLKFYEVIRLVLDKVQSCNNSIEQRKPWAIKEEKARQKFLEDIVQDIFEIAKMLLPFMPETSEKIARVFKTGKSEILFPRL